MEKHTKEMKRDGWRVEAQIKLPFFKNSSLTRSYSQHAKQWAFKMKNNQEDPVES
jgi:hypothetical protein